MPLTDISATATAPSAGKLQDLSAGEIARRIAAGNLSSPQACEYFIARLKAVSGKLNAVTVELFDSARKMAREADKAATRSELAPLAGLPVMIEKCFDLAGTASIIGVPSRRNLIESADDPYVAVADSGVKRARRRSCAPFPRGRRLDRAIHTPAKTQAGSSVLPVRNKQ